MYMVFASFQPLKFARGASGRPLKGAAGLIAAAVHKLLCRERTSVTGFFDKVCDVFKSLRIDGVIDFRVRAAPSK